MYNIVTSFGNYPSNISLDVPGPYTAEELGQMWLRHVASFSKPGMLSKYRLILMLPRDIVIPEHMNVYLDAWGDKRRFDENSKIVAWPMGPNLVFQQILWLYHHKKMEGPFLWVEPDCIPVRPSWLDDLWEEYHNAGKPFMGGLVDVMNANGQRIPKHMTGNGIYPDKPYLLAPAMLEARMTPWDVFAAPQIMKNAHFTAQIQHEYRHEEILGADQMQRTVKATTSLFHTDKFGSLIRLLAGGTRPINQPDNPIIQPDKRGKPLVEVFAEAANEVDEEGSKEPDIDDLLYLLDRVCKSKEAKSKVARYMLEHGIITQGHVTQHNLRKKKEREAHVVEPTA